MKMNQVLKIWIKDSNKNLISELLKLLWWGSLLYIPGLLLGISFLKNTSSINEMWIKSIIDIIHNFSQRSVVAYWIVSVIVTLMITFYLGVYLVEKQKIKNKIYFTEDEINKEFDKNIEDAEKLIICGGDLNFLQNCKKQKEKIEKMSNRVRILAHYDKDLGSKDQKKIYKDLIDNKVQLQNCKKEDGFSVKGQLKKNASGIYSVLFAVKNNEGLYKKIEISDQNIIKILWKELQIQHEKGKNPLIRGVLMDLGGVFFDGDYYKDFLQKVEELLKVKIKRENNEKRLLDYDLNLGEKNIIEYIRGIIKKDLTQKEEEEIEHVWGKVWKPNPKMVEIVKKIKENGVDVYPCSNLDKENGLKYIERGDFLEFSDSHFLSYEMKKVKTKADFFEKLLEILTNKKNNLCPFELVLIDDQEKNLTLARTTGIQGIQYKNPMELENELKKRKII
ncbi:MAG: hypothetical protein ACRC4S_07190 [Cetobacterium sp.]